MQRVNLLSFKNFLLDYYMDIIFIFLLPTISIRVFLFEKGYYFFADQPWPLSNYVNFSAIFSLNSLNGLGFTRIIVTFPYYIIKLIVFNIGVTERLFLFYTFLLYTLLAYLFASIVLNKFYRNKGKYITKFVKFLIVLFIFDNFAALNLNAAGGTYADGLIMIFIAISAFSFLAWKNMKNAFFISSFFLIISILLDPDYATFFIITILFSGIMAGLLNKDFIIRLKYSILTIITALIPIIFIILDFYMTSSTAIGISNSLTARTYNYGAISFFSGNITPLYPILLMGHLWSLIVYAPPNILLYGSKISYVRSLMSPAQLLLPGGMITYLWIFTVVMIPVLSFFSIFFKKTRKISIPVIILVIFFYVLTLVKYIKPLFYIELYLSEIPLIGGTIGTTLALPGHIINVIASMYYILMSLTIANLLSIKEINIRLQVFDDESRVKNVIVFPKKNRFKVIISILLVFIILFSGWQAFDGSFYPARGPDVNIGNAVANTGGFTPVAVNQSVINAYNLIASQNENFNILWIGGPSYSNDAYCSAHPTANIPNFPNLISNNMKRDVYCNLLDSGVKYVVLSNQNIQNNAPDMEEFTFSDAGFNNFTMAQSFFSKMNGLKEIYNQSQVEIYEVSGFSRIYKSSILLDYNGTGYCEDSLPLLFGSMGYKVAILNHNLYGIPIYINKQGTHNSILTPVNISTSVRDSDINYFNVSRNISFSGALSAGGVGLPNNFTLNDWPTNTTYYNYTNGNLNFHMTGGYHSGTSLSYNGSFIGGAGGFYNQNNYIKLNITFYAKSSVNGKDEIIFMGEPKTNIGNDNVYDQLYFNVTSNYKKYTFSYIFTDAEQYVDFRIFDYNPGTFYVKNLSTEYITLPKIVENASMPFSNYVVLSKTLLRGKNKIGLMYMKNSTTSNFKWIKFNYSKGLCIKNKTDIAALISFTNGGILEQRDTSYIVSIDPSLRYYELKYDNKYYRPIPGIYGNSIYIVPANISSLNSIKIIVNGGGLLDIFYVGILLYLLVLLFFMINIYRKNRKMFNISSKSFDK